MALVNIHDSIHEIANEIKNKNSDIKITSHSCDVTNAVQVSNLFQEIKEKHIDHLTPNVIINSAGIGVNASILKTTENEFDEMMSINVKGTHLITQAAVKELIKNYSSFKFENDTQSFASIINLSSQAAKGIVIDFSSNIEFYCFEYFQKYFRRFSTKIRYFSNNVAKFIVILHYD